MLNKICAVAGIVTILLLTFLIPASALQITYSEGEYQARQVPVPVSMAIELYSRPALQPIENYLSLPASLPDKPLYRARGIGYVCEVANFADGTSSVITWQSDGEGSPLSEATSIRYSFPSFAYEVQEVNSFHDGYDENWGTIFDITLDYNLIVTQELEFVYVFEDGTTSPHQSWYQTVYNNGPVAYSRSVGVLPTPADFVSDIVSRYSTTEYALQPLDYILFTRCDFEVKNSTEYGDGVQGLDMRSIVFGAVYSNFEDTQYHLDTTDFTPIGTIHVIFDGDVGVSRLLIGPLEALINFELFPNFSLGSVFVILAGISLFVIVLKVFAGG